MGRGTHPPTCRQPCQLPQPWCWYLRHMPTQQEAIIQRIQLLRLWQLIGGTHLAEEECGRKGQRQGQQDRYDDDGLDNKRCYEQMSRVNLWSRIEA